MRQALNGQLDGSIDVRSELLHAQRERVVVELEPLLRAGPTPVSLVTTIEQVRERDLVISQPVIGGRIRPLARYERYRLRFTGQSGRLVGEVESLGRIKVPAGAHGMLYGYRLSTPPTLRVEDRRRDGSLLLGGLSVPEAQLQVLTHPAAIHGIVEEIGPSSARVVCRNARERVKRAQRAHFRFELPAPVGMIDEVVTITDASPDPQTGEVEVQLTFDQKNEALLDVMRHGWDGAGAGRKSA
jgi:hypothetical protein